MANDQNRIDEEIVQVVQQNVSLFSPSSYNLPHFKYKHLPPSEIRNSWVGWIRWFESIMAAANVTDGASRKMQLLAMGGLELQSAFYGIPGFDDIVPNHDPYQSAKEKLDQLFSPKHHDSFERFMFWTMTPEEDETIDKFALRVQHKAAKCSFGKSESESRNIAVVDKIIQFTPNDLRQKLLEKDILTLDDTLKVVNAYQSVRYQASKMNPKNAISNSTSVNRLYDKPKPNNTVITNLRCIRCGYKRHYDKDRCPALNKTCLKCKKVGHFQSACRSKPPMNNASQDRKRKSAYPNNRDFGNSSKRPRNIFNIDEANQRDPVFEDLPVYNVGDNDEELITCRVGGVHIVMLIDSGSKHNLIDDTTWELMKLKDVQITNQRVDQEKRFLAYGRIPLKLITTFDATLEIEDGDLFSIF